MNLPPHSLCLSPRLQQAADWVRPGVAVVDIGTDHGYLCAYLDARNKKQEAGNGVLPLASNILLPVYCPLLLACDIAEKPLQNTAKTLERYGLSEHVKLRLSDGLDNVLPHEADDILMLGMGGTLIARLLGRCAWIKDKSKRLILQPMSRAEEVRVWLCDNGFVILEEAVVREGRRLYVLIRAGYTSSNASEFPFGYEYFGELPRVNTPEAKAVLKHTVLRLEKKAYALKKAGKIPEGTQAEKLANATKTAMH